MAISQSYRLLGPHLHRDVGRLIKAAESGALGHLLKSSVGTFTSFSPAAAVAARFASPIVSCTFVSFRHRRQVHVDRDGLYPPKSLSRFTPLKEEPERKHNQ